MNIGIFTDTYYPQINGVATSTRILEKELTKLGHRVFIFTTSDPHVDEITPRVFRLPSLPFYFLPSHRVAYSYSPKLLARMKKFNLDIIHTQTEFPLGIFGRVISELFHIPSVHTYHTMYEDYVHYIAKGHLITPKMAQQFSRIFCNRSRVVIAPVQKTKESLLQYGVKKPITIIPTGIDFEPFRKERYSKEEINNLKLELDINLTDPIIITICRIAKEKSIDVIIKEMPKVLEKIPNSKFVIVGDGPLRETLIELAKSLNIENSVKFIGAIPWENIGKYYQLGDVFVSASTSETQGLTYIEAMASKLPVVAKLDKSIEGVVIHGETGYYFEKDEDAASVLCKVLVDRKEADEISVKGYNSILHLSAYNFAKSVEELYLKTIDEYPKDKKIKFFIRKPIVKLKKFRFLTKK